MPEIHKSEYAMTVGRLLESLLRRGSKGVLGGEESVEQNECRCK